ncbi:MAG: DUF4091 domain-containing protein [Chloroflexia bacterium]|nr:DUF4091 domain-containing protein [Chloroflexia bacterium]
MADTNERFYPRSPAREQPALTIETLRGARTSFQVVTRTGGDPVDVGVTVETPEGVEIRVRRVGYVPMVHLNTDTPDDEREGMGHLPGLVPDPLLPECDLHAGSHETNAFWISLLVAPDAAPGPTTLRVRIMAAGEPYASLTVTLLVHAAVLPPRRDFAVTHWFYADAVADWYKVDLWTNPFWRIAGPYLRNLSAHGQNVVYTPIFTPPLDGVKRPTQLLGVSRDGDRYHFDWTHVRRWIGEARAAGLETFEWTHFFTQWGARHAIRVYEGHGADKSLLWDPETPATAPIYRDFLAQFLPEWQRFLRDEGLLERSLFHLSDEPHGVEQLASYTAARNLLRQLAPWMRVMDALSEVDFASAGVTDMPIPVLSSVPEFIAGGFPHWAYFCCQPRGRYLNRLFDTPLSKIRLSGWLLYRTGARGFLHWGANYWYKRQTTELIDPFAVADAHAWPNWAYGDPFVLYPGADGPLDSIRWEVFAESLQDYALLQMADVGRDDPLLAPLVDYADFPRDPAWLHDARRQVRDRIVRDSAV